MTVVKKIYRIKLPLNLDEYRRGIRYAISKMTTDEITYIQFNRKFENNIIRTESRKFISLEKRMPYLVKKSLPTKALLQEEYSVTMELVNGQPTDNLDGHTTHTIYKNQYFDESTFKMTVEAKVCGNDNFNFNNPDIKIEDIDFRTYFKTPLIKVNDRDYSGNFEEKYNTVYIYKYIEIEINSTLFGWMCKKIAESLRDTIVELQHVILRDYDSWTKMSETELENYENKIIKQFSKDKSTNEN